MKDLWETISKIAEDMESINTKKNSDRSIVEHNVVRMCLIMARYGGENYSPKNQGVATFKIFTNIYIQTIRTKNSTKDDVAIVF